MSGKQNQALTPHTVFNYLKPFLTFTTEKTVTFRDWRLGIIHKVLYLGIVLYTCVLIFRNKSFLENHSPLNVVTMFSSTTGSANILTPVVDYDTAQDYVYDNMIQSPTSTFAYCNNPSYDFVYSEEFKYQNISCYFGSAREVSTKLPPAGIFFTTFQDTTSTTTFMTNDGATCTRMSFLNRGLSCSSTSSITIRGPRCECIDKSNAFFVGTENTILNIEHRYDSVPQSGALPKTRIRLENSENDLFTFAEGTKVQLPLRTLLEYGGVNLDSAFSSDWSLRGASNSPNQYPMQRLTGVAITIKASYYNYNQVPHLDSTGTGTEDDVECVMEIQPAVTWTSLGDYIDYRKHVFDSSGNSEFVNRYRYGVYINVEAAGIISEFNYTVLIMAIIQGLVLLRVADVVCSLIAYYFMGNRSKLFQAFGNENVSYNREYARYAAQILVTGKLFDLLDTNNNNVIEKAEIYRMLKDSPCTYDMPKSNLKMLGAMILEQVDASREKLLASKTKRESNSQRSSGSTPSYLSEQTKTFIEPFELLDLLYPDQCSEEGLEHALKDMSQSQKEKLLFRAKSFRDFHE